MATINRFAGLDFDTKSASLNFTVSMKTNFYLRVNANKGKATIYLSITHGKEKERVSTKLECNTEDWLPDKQRIKNVNETNIGINTQLNYIESKINKITMYYFINEKQLSPSTLLKELNEASHRVSFYSYFSHIIDIGTHKTKGTNNRLKGVMNNMMSFKKELYFSDITYNFLKEYRSFLSKDRQQTTVNANFSAIRMVLYQAKKDNIFLNIDPSDIKVGNTNGNKLPLDIKELKKIYDYYISEFCNESHSLILGYFLFGCFSGLRFSDIMNIKREQLTEDRIFFKATKTKKDQTIQLNQKVKEIIKKNKDLFIKRYTNQQCNRELKIICKFLGVTKKVTFHISRHTFAINYLRQGGNAENLQKLLGHSNIRETMSYVNILAEDANKDIHKLDGLF